MRIVAIKNSLFNAQSVRSAWDARFSLCSLFALHTSGGQSSLLHHQSDILSHLHSFLLLLPMTARVLFRNHLDQLIHLATLEVDSEPAKEENLSGPQVESLHLVLVDLTYRQHAEDDTEAGPGNVTRVRRIPEFRLRTHLPTALTAI